MLFLSQTFQSPRCTGAIAPSSKKLAALVVEKAQLKEAKSVVELGPGTGVFSKEIISRISKNTVYFAIEINDNFVEDLAKKFPELKVCHNSAENIKKCLQENKLSCCDRVVSGLPWTAFETGFQKKLVEKIHDVLEDGGIFVTFCYYPLNYLPGGKSFKTMLNEYFPQVIESEIVCNIPPAFVYICKK